MDILSRFILSIIYLYYFHICTVSFAALFLFQRVSRGKKEGSVINQNILGNTFSSEKRVKPTDRPPPKKLPSPSGMGKMCFLAF